MKSSVWLACMLLLLWVAPHRAVAQCTTLDFSLPATACMGQSLFLAPNGTYTNPDWDFCAGDLSQTPTATVLTNSFGGFGFKVKVAEDNGLYYGFLLTRARNTLYRLDFGSNINSTPVLTNLGGLGISSSTWRVIDVVKEGSVWYGFIVDVNTVYRITFGNSLGNPPSNVQQIFTGDPVNASLELTIVDDGNQKFVFIGNNGNNKLVRMAFGSSYGTAPASVAVDAITITPIYGLSFMKDCGTWYAVGTTQNVIHKIIFNAGLTDLNPTVVDYTPPNPNVRGISLVFDDGQYYAFTQQENAANLYRVNFGTSLANNPSSIDLLQNLGYSGTDFWASSMFKAKSDWMLMAPEGSGANIYRVTFPNACMSATSVSTQDSPSIVINMAGSFKVSLRAQDATGKWMSKSHAITVSSSTAPDIDFTSQNNCANNNVNFTSVNASGNINTYAWSFGDAGSGAGATASHIYSSSGTFTVGLTANASNGCSNAMQHTIQIFNQPVANFSLPSTSPVCSNQDYILTNGSTFDIGSNPAWEWRVNGTLVSSQKDFTANFSSAVPQTIKLKAIIPGCENEVTKNIATVVSGPAVDFTSSNNCSAGPVSFSNLTTGTVDAGYNWAFGDATSSTVVAPQHTYASAGNYNVTLTASNLAGCNNFKTKTIQIFSVPQPDFSLGAPPFSCTNSPSAFQNLTPNLTDSNITGWAWEFNDAASGTSSVRDAAYTFTTAANYNVKLTATSDAGCANSVTKQVTISSAPIADFTLGPSCLNLATKFTDLSSGGVSSRNWQIGPANFVTQNPTYTFTSSGDYTASLTVTSANGCSNVKSKTVTVPVPAAVAFNNANLCAGKDATFTDATFAPRDAVVGWNWNFDGNSVTGNPATFDFPAAGTFNVKLTTTHASGCKYTLSKNVAINITPVADFTASPDRGQAPLVVQFSNTSQGATSYAWKFYDKTTATSSAVSPTYTFTALGDYSAELTAMNGAGCSDVKTIPIKVLVPVIDLAMTGFSLVNDPLTARLKGVVTIANNGNVPAGFVDIALILADKATVHETVQVDLSPGQSVTKTLSFTFPTDANAFLCAEIVSEKDTRPYDNKQCINFESGEYFFNPYPNPTSGPLQIDWISSVAGTTHVVVYDNVGKKTYESLVSSIAGLNRVLVDLSFLQAGLYYVTIETPVSRRTTRILHQ